MGHVTWVQFDFNLGRPVDAEDANGIVASGYYDDSLDRPTQIKRAVVTAVENQTTFTYDDTNRIITTTRDRDANNDNLLVSKLLYDQLGRTSEPANMKAARITLPCRRNTMPSVARSRPLILSDHGRAKLRCGRPPLSMHSVAYSL